MGTFERPENGISLMDAVEAVATIAETHWENDEHLLVEVDEEELFNWKDPHWLYSRDKEKAQEAVRGIFKVILTHLKNFYATESLLVTNSKTLEGIKTIMVLVGEAARKIDRYTELFKEQKFHSIADVKEYKLLQDFYKRKISRTIDEALLGKWILALSERKLEALQRDEARGVETRHVFVDLDGVKKDSEYELFFVRKEDGTRFFSPRLIRNIKLVCDFGSYLGKEKEIDPLVDQFIWEDRYSRCFARSVLEFSRPIVEQYYPLIVRNKEREWVAAINKAFIALLSAVSKERLVGSGSWKGCTAYLADFQGYLRELLHHREYQQLILCSAAEKTPLQEGVNKIVSSFLKGIYLYGSGCAVLEPYVRYLLSEGNKLISVEHRREALKSRLAWSRLASDFMAMQKVLKHHPNGPLNKVLALLEEGNYQCYDPYIHRMFPERLFQIEMKGKITSLHTLSSPTVQEFIHQAKAIEEFQEFLRTMQQERKKILLINFQDRTTWREYARSTTLEQLQEGSEFSESLSVVTLPKDTEFYFQEAPYDEDHQLVVFKRHLLEHLFDNQAGFYFPEHIAKEINPVWVNAAFDVISKIFFSSRNVLSKEARLDFIEIFYLFLELKIIAAMQPDHVYFTCKDGVDISSTAAFSLFMFLKLLPGETFSDEEFDFAAGMLSAPALIRRERVLLAERFQRMLSALKLLEHAQQDLGADGLAKAIKGLELGFQILMPFSRRSHLAGIDEL